MIDKDIPIEAYMSRDVHSIRHDASADDALSQMSKHGVRHLPVLEAGRLVGLLSDRDLRLALSVSDADAKAIIIEAICAPIVYSVPPSTPLSSVAQEMADKRYGSCVVVDDDEHVLGMFTTVDACRALAAALES
jgi:acetoin utilization protein AcuB